MVSGTRWSVVAARKTRQGEQSVGTGRMGRRASSKVGGLGSRKGRVRQIEGRHCLALQGPRNGSEKQRVNGLPVLFK